MKKKIGAITIGQSPRTDVLCDILPILGNNIEILEAGALDGLTNEEISEFAPEEGDYVLLTRLRDGSTVTIAEKHIIARLQQCVKNLEGQGVQMIIFLCTGEFPGFKADIPLIFPSDILIGCVTAITAAAGIAVILPSSDQLEQTRIKWKDAAKNVTLIPASPFTDNMDIAREAANKIKDLEVDLIVLDCISYTREMKKVFVEITGKNTILSRTLAARVAMEIIDEGY